MKCPKCKSKNTEYGDRITVSDGKGGTKILYHKCMDCEFRYDHDGIGKITSETFWFEPYSLFIQNTLKNRKGDKECLKEL